MASMMETTQRLQAEAFKAFGLVVKNTFIDDAAPALEVESPATRRRASSVPAALKMASGQDVEEYIGAVKSCPLSACVLRGRGCCVPGEELSKCCSPASTCSGREFSPASSVTTNTSTTISCSTPTECTGLIWAEATDDDSEEADSSPETEVSPEVGSQDQALTAELAAIVERECSFLRLAGHAIYDESSNLRRRRGVSKCVVFYCRGLPWAKRAKWLLPLLWSVAAVLKNAGCTTKVQAGELYVQLPSTSVCRSGCDFLRLDFGAAHL